MARKKKTQTSKLAGEITEPELVVKKSTNIDNLIREIGQLTYGQCTVLKLELDRRMAATRARRR
jgi:hypothetical protein